VRCQHEHPNGTMTSIEITPPRHRHKTVSIPSTSGGSRSRGNSVDGVCERHRRRADTGSRRSRRGRGCRRRVGRIGSRPGAASVTHSWNLKADAAGRSASCVVQHQPGSGLRPASAAS
jgi:hypothetical protein